EEAASEMLLGRGEPDTECDRSVATKSELAGAPVASASSIVGLHTEAETEHARLTQARRLLNPASRREPAAVVTTSDAAGGQHGRHASRPRDSQERDLDNGLR